MFIELYEPDTVYSALHMPSHLFSLEEQVLLLLSSNTGGIKDKLAQGIWAKKWQDQVSSLEVPYYDTSLPVLFGGRGRLTC